MQFLNKNSKISYCANVAGINGASTTHKGKISWIVDTRATSHIEVDLSLLGQSLSRFSTPNKVYFQNEDVALYTHTESSNLTKADILSRVFYIPEFKLNLLFVSKVTKVLFNFLLS